MIDHEHKFILILLPKTGTTTLSNFLGGGIKNTVYKHYDNINDTSVDYLKFSTRRNPFARVVSSWKFWNRKLKKAKKPTTGFSHFVKNYRKMQKKILKITHKLDVIHFKSCVDGVMCATNNKISYKDIDLWIRTEHLQEDFNIVCDKIGIPRQQLPHKNTTKHKHYTEYYNDEIREIVEELYAKDIEYFGYKFGE